jgi:uncharacterized protein YbaA (DUF1428 family)
MKIKAILGVAVAAVATMMMSMVASAATELKIGDITENSAGTYIIVPVVSNTTGTDNLGAYDITLNYDSSKYTYGRIVDSLTYVNDFDETTNYGTITTNANENKNGAAHFVWYRSNEDAVAPVPDENGQIKIAEVWFKKVDSPSASDFSITVAKIATDTESLWEDLHSFFSFDVTGDLGGNKIVALAASTDGGASKQALEYYTTTTLADDSTDYAGATTTFVVSVNNTTGETAVADITIYGQKEDGTWIPLSSYDKTNFQIQAFE